MTVALLVILSFCFLGLLFRDKKKMIYLLVSMNLFTSFLVYNWGSVSLGLTHFIVFAFINVFLFVTSDLFKSRYSTISILRKRTLNSVGSAVLVFLLIGAFSIVFNEKFPGERPAQYISGLDFSFFVEVILSNWAIIFTLLFVVLLVISSFLITEDKVQ